MTEGKHGKGTFGDSYRRQSRDVGGSNEGNISGIEENLGVF